MGAYPPVASGMTDIFSVGQLAERIIDDINEPLNDKNRKRVMGYIGDAIESVWMTILLATLSRLSKGPVNQVFPANTTSVPLITVADPTAGPVVSQIVQGNLGARTVYIGIALVTDSGSTTKVSPLTTVNVLANNLCKVVSPVQSALTLASDSIGYYVFAGLNADGSDLGLQSPLIPFGTPWFEPNAGIVPAPNTPYPPTENTTADNIFDIVRLDVQNEDMTWTNWIQSTMDSTWFTEFQHKIGTSTTWMPFVYDFIEGRQVEVRPAPAANLTGTYFYTTRPRRPRFPNSRIPFTSYAIQGFLHDYCCARLTLGIYEYDASDRWDRNASAERQRILLQVGQGNWHKNTTIRPFLR